MVPAQRRELGTGLLRRHDTRSRRLTIRTTSGLAARLARGSVLTWTVAVAAIGILFAAMRAAVVDQQRRGDVGGFLGAQLGGSDPAAGYLSYAAQAAVTAGGAVLILTATAALTALIAPAVLDGDDIATRAFVFTIGQWPAAAAMTGWTTLLIGAFPRLRTLARLPLTVSATLALLGDLLEVPRHIQNLGLFQHVPDAAAPEFPPVALLVLIGIGATTYFAGLAGVSRRDLVAG